jgi:hypothetical protein
VKLPSFPQGLQSPYHGDQSPATRREGDEASQQNKIKGPGGVGFGQRPFFVMFQVTAAFIEHPNVFYTTV